MRLSWVVAQLLLPSVTAALLIGSHAVQAQSLSATVLSIGDGDTIRVRQAGRALTVRLACIDAPETAQSPYGQQARGFLQKRLSIGREVTLAVKTTDRYGRSVAEVFSGVNINLALVEDGHVFVYRQYLGGCNAGEYLAAEDRANRARLGVWQVQGGITRPWDFRRVPRFRCSEIDSYVRAQQLLRQGHHYLDGNGDGEACESLQR